MGTSKEIDSECVYNKIVSSKDSCVNLPSISGQKIKNSEKIPVLCTDNSKITIDHYQSDNITVNIVNN